MNRRAAILFMTGFTALFAGCSTQRQVAAVENVPPPVDDAGRPMGPMPLAVGDRVGRSVYMTRPALVTRGLVRTDSAFADGGAGRQSPND